MQIFTFNSLARGIYLSRENKSDENHLIQVYIFIDTIPEPRLMYHTETNHTTAPLFVWSKYATASQTYNLVTTVSYYLFILKKTDVLFAG